jgi:hypothetical protein
MGWTHTDLTGVTGAPASPTAPWAYMFDAQRTQHVVQIAEDGHVVELSSDRSGWQLWWAADGWHFSNLTAETGAPPAALCTPVGYVLTAQGTEHVDYVGIVDNHIQELRWQPRVRRPVDPLPPLAGAAE